MKKLFVLIFMISLFSGNIANNTTAYTHTFPIAKSDLIMSGTRTVLTGTFYDQKRNGKVYLKGHKAWDLPVAVGTNIEATLDGIVIETGINNTRGGYVTVLYSDGTTHTFMHLSNLNKLEGGRVKQGEVIAKSGNSGNSSGPHVHWEVRNSNGDLMNPRLLVGGQYSPRSKK